MATIKRQLNPIISSNTKVLTPEIPLFVVGYEGWKSIETVQEHIGDAPISGILIIDPGLYVSSPSWESIRAEGSWALWGLICSLHRAVTGLQVTTNKPIRYAVPDPSESLTAADPQQSAL